MNTIDALRQRKSVRAFLDKDIEPEKIKAILTAASCTPSGANMQPWQVAVVTGTSKQKLQEKIENRFRSEENRKGDYQYYPLTWRHPYKRRRVNCGRQMYNALDIQRKEKQKRFEQWVANYRSFDAPVMLIFFLDASMQAGAFLDCGMFLQSIMLSAMEYGLSTCTQASLSEFPEIIKESLGYPQDATLVCGMALGYEDTDAAINNYRTPREAIESFTRFYS
jgi:nitroreductase